MGFKTHTPDSDGDDPKVDFEFAVNPQHMRPGVPMDVPILAPAQLMMIGSVAVFWGNLELALESLLSSALQAEPAPPEPGWERKSFGDKMKLLTKRLRRILGEGSDGFSYLKWTIDGATQFHPLRNLLLHGSYTGEVSADGTPVSITVRGYWSQKRQVILPLENDMLSRIYHEIGHLTGGLRAAFDPVSTHPLAPAERERLLRIVMDYPPQIVPFIDLRPPAQ